MTTALTSPPTANLSDNQTERYAFTIPEIANFLEVSIQFLHKQTKLHSWQPTGERVQGGGDKYDIDKIIFYKSTEKHEAAKQKIKDKIKEAAKAAKRATKHAVIKKLHQEELQDMAEQPMDDMETRDFLWDEFWKKSNKKKEKATERVKAVMAFYERKDGQGMKIGDAYAATAAEFNVTPLAVRNWVNKSKGLNRTDRICALVSQQQGGKVIAEFTPEAWTFFKRDYLRRGRRSIAACYRDLQAAARVHGWTVPIKRTVENWIRRELDPMVIKYRREGMEAVEKCFPAMKRNKEMFDVLEAVNGDGYEFEMWVDFGNDIIAKPKAWFWQDIRSSKLLSWRVDVSENTEVIRLAILDLVTDWGIPKYFWLDNTRAAANKTVTGGVPNRYRYKVKETDPMGIIPMLQAEVKWALPAHGQSKPVERVFGIGGMGDFTSQMVFADRGTKSRPVPIAEFESVLKAFVQEINARPDRLGDAVRGKSFDQVFNELYPEAVITKATEKQRRLCLCAVETVTASRTNGSFTLAIGRASFGENRYWHEELTKYLGQKVTVRFDPADLHGGVFVENLAGEPICTATATHTGGFKDAQAAKEVARARGHFKKAVRLSAEAEGRISAAEARAQMPEVVEPEKPEPGKVVRMLPGVPNGELTRPKVVNGDTGGGPTEEMERNFAEMTRMLREARKNAI